MTNSPAQTAPYPAIRSVIWPMALMFVAANIYNIDRLIVGILAEPIRKDLQISDFQMSLLLGLAYSLFSGTFGLALGYLVDSRTRRTVLAVSITLWSVATIAGGLAPSFGWFFVFRAVVGLGEAALAPASMSLIADMFPAHRRGRALSLYLIGATIGSSLAAIVPGLITTWNLHLTAPFFGMLSSWRTTFVLCGLMGPVLGLLFMTVREPVRRMTPMKSAGRSKLVENLRYLGRNKAVLGPLYGGFCLFYIALIGITSWTAAFLTRAYHLNLSDFAAPLGLMALVSGTLGYSAGGFLTDSTLIRRWGGKPVMLMLIPIAALPCTLAAFAPTQVPALIALSAISITAPMLNVAVTASVQDFVPNTMRGFFHALLTVSSAFFAGAGGPLFVALATEHIFKDPAMIGFSFTLVGIPALAGSSLCFAWSRRALHRAMAAGSELATAVNSSRA